jgi:hypothetical protein
VATAQESFESKVIAPFQFNVGGRNYSYADYLDLPPHQRSGHEAAVVDIKFTQKMLEWLGYGEGDIKYNATLTERPTNKPDFRIELFGSPVFIVEDKNTTEVFNNASAEQLRRYTTGTSGYCLWTNGKIILGLQFDPNGQYKNLVEVRVELAFGNQRSLFSQESNFEILQFLFAKKRFLEISFLIEAIAVDESNWKPKSLNNANSLHTFISECRFVLDQLVTDVQARLNTVAMDMDESSKDALNSRAESRRIRSAYLVWRGRYRMIESIADENSIGTEERRQKAFAEQVSYVFFVRLLLARVLEDKGIMPRLVSDGSFSAWHNFLKLYDTESINDIRGASFLPLVYRRVASFYRHFFQQPIFDWFLPDDYLIVLVLHQLNKYHFKDVKSDILGYTYESFIDRVARNSKGHFLTPPPLVEYMLDRINYNTSSIIGERLLDPACGSGSFLVHSVGRLRDAIFSAMGDLDPIKQAETFIEHVITRLVGLEINPFSCYLAELNLFIQVIDELSLLWKSGRNYTIERFAIYNTNSLDMPQEVLQSNHNNTTIPLVNIDTVLDKAASIKALKDHFRYVVSNPPYINRGINLEAKSYGDFPFYSDVVKGDENFYLLFLRLADYYAAPYGSICFICPLNLIGDESTMRAREIFSGEDWSMHSITRFYARNILFPGVLQGVCVIRLDKIKSQASDIVEVREGFDVQEAAQSCTQVQRYQITQNYPQNNNWSKPWLVNANSNVYRLWEYIKVNSLQDLSELIRDKIDAGKGDIRSTWTKPLLVPHPGPNILPVTKGNHVLDWGDWFASSYIDPSITISRSMNNATGSLWTQRQAQRVAQLTQVETVIFLKEVSGLEMKRPIRGTILQRDARNLVVADETLLVMRTLEGKHENLAFAVFGLLTSLTYNFLFSLFSTNAHVSFKEIMRLPVPNWSLDLEANLAQATKNVIAAYKKLYEHQDSYGIGQNQDSLDANKVLKLSALQTLCIEEMIMRGDIEMDGPNNQSLESLLRRGKLRVSSRYDQDVVQSIEHILRANKQLTYIKGGNNLLVPHPRIASVFLSKLAEAAKERKTILHLIDKIQESLDNTVLDAYSINEDGQRAMIKIGVPWARN